MYEPVLDAHVHFWDTGRLEYPWLAEFPSLRGRFDPADHAAAMRGVPLEGIVFVEGNPRPDLALEEIAFVEELALAGSPIAAIVAYLNLLDDGLGSALDALGNRALVRGVRHNIQGNPPGFALQPRFVAGLREIGRRGLTFDICVTHDQLDEAVALARQAEDTPLVLDHCGKPGIRDGVWEPWASGIRRLAELPNVWCKISGLLTEADPVAWRPEQILRYADHVVEWFGTDRVIYGSDWPVVTLTDRSDEWYPVTQQFTARWTAAEKQRFYRDNARRFYGLQS